MNNTRKSGILLSVSSLPSKYGIGDFGKNAYKFVDQLIACGSSVWQILPLNPNGPGNSPYQAYSAYAGDTLYISPEVLATWGLLSTSDLLNRPAFEGLQVDFDKVSLWKASILQIAFQNFENNKNEALQNEFNHFKNEHDWWLNDYALYIACKKRFDGQSWNQWPSDIAKREPAALEQYTLMLANVIVYEKFCQFLFFKQWFSLKNYANQNGVQIFGDLPLYVALDSSDVWANQEFFMLDKAGNPLWVGGVPPDYFSEDGQLWGNPVFDWEKLAETQYQWWHARLYFNFHLFNLVRIDHFRGLESFWAIPANAVTAKEGKWMPAHGAAMLDILYQRMGKLPIIAEDLGLITPEVDALRIQFDLPGMKVLQFAFASDAQNEHLPHNLSTNCVVYTGTHDNDTLKGWWGNNSADERKMVRTYVKASRGCISARLIEMAWASVAKLAIVPLQDLMEMGSEGRMNTPGTATGNWRWRYLPRQLMLPQLNFLKMLNDQYNRK
ncbi:MAG TPA: 4-alpha-glucanotransferase [Prolixibacteraceae bacterium]|nr:4-alpha-glucanotransferase [Prolixibacteraceae bacterium]